MASQVRHPIDTSLAPRLRGGETLHGVFNSLPSPAIVEMCAYAGFDFIVLDNEHGSADLQTTGAHAAGRPRQWHSSHRVAASSPTSLASWTWGRAGSRSRWWKRRNRHVAWPPASATPHPMDPVV